MKRLLLLTLLIPVFSVAKKEEKKLTTQEEQIFLREGEKYIPMVKGYLSQAAAVAVEVTFPAVDDDAVIVAVAAQPYSDDKSIWKVTLSASQTPSSGAVQIKLTEDGVDKYFNVAAAVEVHLLNDGGC